MGIPWNVRMSQVMGMETIGILCERVRVEEKQILAVLLNAGLPAVPVPPVDLPVAIGAGPEGHAIESLAGQYFLLIDRCPERTASNHLVLLLADSGTAVLGAGVASTGNRLDVARKLAGAGIARPRTVFAGSEKAGLAALSSFGYPSTLMPLAYSKRPLPIFDEDIAEAVLEHRNTLGSASARSLVIQEGSPSITEVIEVMVVDGAAVAASTAGKPALRSDDVLKLAEHVAAVLDARIIGIQIAQTASGLVVWDVNPVPEFRGFNLTSSLPVADAIGALVANQLHHHQHSMSSAGNRDTSALGLSTALKESARGVVITA